MDDQLSSVLYSYAFIKNYLWPLSSLLCKFPTNGHQRCNTRDRSVSPTNSIPRVIHEMIIFVMNFSFLFTFAVALIRKQFFFAMVILVSYGQGGDAWPQFHLGGGGGLFEWRAKWPVKEPRGYSWEFLVGVCRTVLQILTLFHTHAIFTPVFRPGLWEIVIIT